MIDVSLIRECSKDEASASRIIDYIDSIVNSVSKDDISFSRLFNFSPDPILITRLEDGQVLDMNAGFVSYTGYSEDELRTTNPHLWVDRTQRDEMVALLHRDKIIQNFHGVFRHKDGHIIHGLLSGEIIDFNGVPAFFSMARDITDIVRAKEALKKSEERYRHLIDRQSEVICAYKPDGTFTFANEAYCKYFGHDYDSIIGQNILDIVPKKIYPAVKKHIDFLLDLKEPYLYERESLHANGEWRWLEWSDKPILDADGNIIEIQAVGRDITDRKQAEINTELLLDSLPRTSLFVFDSNLKFTFAQGNTIDLIGLTADQLIGQTMLDLFTKEHKTSTETICRAVLEGEQLEFEYTFENITLRVEAYPIKHGKHIIAGAAVVEDITERKAANQRELELQLERQRVALIADFITSTQHEFRTPLSVIESSVYIAEKTDDSEQQKKAYDKVRHQVKRLSRLVDELTMMARLDAGVDMLVKNPVNINYAVNYAIDDCRSRIMQKNIQVDTQLVENPPDILGNIQHMTDAIRHLLDNAIQHTPDSGLITIKTEHNDSYLCLIIQDTGIGIDEQDAPHIFERFYRTDKAHSTPGFGLGLPIVEKIIQSHRGKIAVQSEPQNGTKIVLSFPLDEPTEEPSISEPILSAEKPDHP